MEYMSYNLEELENALREKLENLLKIEKKSETASNSLCDMLETLSDIHFILVQTDSTFGKYGKTRKIFESAVLHEIQNYLKKENEAGLKKILSSEGMQTLQKGKIGLFHNIVWDKKHSDKVKSLIQNYMQYKEDKSTQQNANNRSNLFEICDLFKSKARSLPECIESLYEKKKNSKNSDGISKKLEEQFKILTNVYEEVAKLKK